MTKTMSNVTNYNFILNNVKGIQVSKRRLKLFEYLKQNINFNGFILFQERHSLLNDGKQWKDYFNVRVFFSHGKKNLAVLQPNFVEKIISI